MQTAIDVDDKEDMNEISEQTLSNFNCEEARDFNCIDRALCVEETVQNVTHFIPTKFCNP